MAIFPHHHYGFDKLVSNAALITLLDRCDWIRSALAFAVHQHLVSAFNSVPTLVAIHRVIATAQRSDFADADLHALLLHHRDVLVSRFRRSVAAIKEAMNMDATHFSVFGHL